jgi:flagellar hook protein FlgE
MLESIYIGTTGLLGYSKGLRVIANNTSNMNTPGFKGSTLQFSDLFYASAGGQDTSQFGYGLNTTGTSLSFSQGELRQTGNDLDVAVDGQGLFVLQHPSGELTYTRAGQFAFDKDGILVNQGSGERVVGYDGSGNLADISIAGHKTHLGKATTRVKFSGNLLSSGTTDQTLNNIKVIDVLGGEHLLSAKFVNTGATTPGSFSVELFDGTTSVGTGSLVFADGRPKEGAGQLAFTYTPSGLSAMPLTLDFGTDVTSQSSASLAALSVSSQDGYAPGSLTKAAFDTAGVLTMTYSNGQTVQGNRLALARFDSLSAVQALGDNQFEAKDAAAWHMGTGSDAHFGNVRSGMVEISNVDLSKEFSDLVIMQRGYQASSQIISTANDMLQQLFSMTSK